jgi:hypothetical protein
MTRIFGHSLFLFIIFSQMVSAEVKFDGYYKIVNKGKHTGFVVERDEVDPKSKIMTVRYFVYFGPKETEFVVATFRSDFSPISFKSDGLKEGIKRSLAGTCDHSTCSMPAQDDSQEVDLIPLNGHTYLAAGLGLVLAAAKIKVGTTYNYDGIAEDSGQAGAGEVTIVAETNVETHKVYRAWDSMIDIQTEIWFTDQGEILRSKSTQRDVTAELTTADLAIGELEFQRSSLVKLFGDIPGGTTNILASGKINLTSLFSVAFDYTKIKKSEPILLRPIVSN